MLGKPLNISRRL